MAKSRNLENQLLRLKRELEEKKQERAILQGELKALNKQLKDEFNIDNLEQAKEFIKKEEISIQKLENEIVEGLDKVNEMIENEN